MRLFLWVAPILVISGLLASCGGGSEPKSSDRVSVICDSSTLWAARPSLSGLTIPDNNPSGISVTWDNQNCTLQTVSSVALDICLKHDQPTDLSWTITPPSPTNAITLVPPASWNTLGTACGDQGPTQGQLHRIELPTTNISSARGLWTLQVKDQVLGTTGTLIQWRVIIQGYN